MASPSRYQAYTPGSVGMSALRRSRAACLGCACIDFQRGPVGMDSTYPPGTTGVAPSRFSVGEKTRARRRLGQWSRTGSPAYLSGAARPACVGIASLHALHCAARTRGRHGKDGFDPPTDVKSTHGGRGAQRGSARQRTQPGIKHGGMIFDPGKRGQPSRSLTVSDSTRKDPRASSTSLPGGASRAGSAIDAPSRSSSTP